MHVVEAIGASFMGMHWMLNYLFLYDGSFASYLKVGYEIWWAWITVECWIKFVNHNFRIEIVWLLEYRVLLNLIGILMYTASLWEVTKDDLKNV